MLAEHDGILAEEKYYSQEIQEPVLIEDESHEIQCSCGHINEDNIIYDDGIICKCGEYVPVIIGKSDEKYSHWKKILNG